MLNRGDIESVYHTLQYIPQSQLDMYVRGFSHGEHLTISENNSSHTLIEGMRGPPGLPGPQGKEGAAALKNGEATYIRWGKSSLRGGRVPFECLVYLRSLD